MGALGKRGVTFVGVDDSGCVGVCGGCHGSASAGSIAQRDMYGRERYVRKTEPAVSKEMKFVQTQGSGA